MITEVEGNMNQKSLVSVLMPVFRADKNQLKIAVDSILMQTYRCLELLVLFEGTEEDPCYIMLQGIQDKRLKVVLIPLKSGLPKSLNIGIERAEGKYIARMDADDYSLPDRFVKQINFLESHPDIDAVGGICRYMNSRTLSFSTMIPPERRSARMLFSHAGVAHPTAVIKRAFIEKNKIRYNETIKGSEDYHLWIDFVLAGGRIDSVNQIVLLYRISEGQAHNLLKNEMIEWDNLGREKILNKIGQFREDEKEMIYQFCRFHNREISVLSTLNVLEKLSRLGSHNSLFMDKVFQKEVCYEWIQKSLLSYKNGNGKEMLRSDFVKKLWVRGELTYLLSEYFRKITGKIIPLLKVNWRTSMKSQA